MKSNLFQKHDFSRMSDFVKDASILSNLPSEALQAIPELTIQMIEKKNKQEEEEVCTIASKKLNVPFSQLSSAIDLSKFFLRQMIKDGDAADDLSSDLAEDFIEFVKILENARIASLKSYFEELGSKKNNAQQIILRQQTSQSSLPFVKKITSTVNLRAIFESSFGVGDDIDNYRPKCAGVVPIGIIQLNLSDEPNPVFFQADARSIKLLKEQLVSLEKEIESTRQYFDLK